MALIGDGTIGNVLWIRSEDGRWIVVPNGAGEDANVRSVNVWDGSSWQTVTSARYLQAKALAEGAIATFKPDAVDFYAPGVSWLNSGQNPNVAGGTFWTPLADDWVRLFHTAPRVDPKWRILSLLDPHRLTTPSRSLTGTTTFWPIGGVYGRVASGFDNGTITYQPDERTALGPYQTANPQPYTLTHWSLVRSFDSVDPANPRRNETTVSQTYMMDLKEIRKRLGVEFPQRNLDYQGQYDPIATQNLKRVFFTGTVSFTGYFRGAGAPVPGAVLAVRGRIYAQTGAAGTAVTVPVSGIPGVGDNTPYYPRTPTSNTPAGTVLYDKALPSITTWTQYDAADGTYFTGNTSVQENVTFTFENPGEDNITLTAVVDNVGGHNSGVSGAEISFEATSITMQYATTGSDVPSNKRLATVKY